jgi:hypothetical protein
VVGHQHDARAIVEQGCPWADALRASSQARWAHQTALRATPLTTTSRSFAHRFTQRNRQGAVEHPWNLGGPACVLDPAGPQVWTFQLATGGGSLPTAALSESWRGPAGGPRLGLRDVDGWLGIDRAIAGTARWRCTSHRHGAGGALRRPRDGSVELLRLWVRAALVAEPIPVPPGTGAPGTTGPGSPASASTVGPVPPS